MAESTRVIDVVTPLGFRAVCSVYKWERIVRIKHPAMLGRLEDVVQALQDPDVVRRSVADAEVVLFYRRIELRWVCAVVKRAEGLGYLITAYPADKVKQGEVLWKR